MKRQDTTYSSYRAIACLILVIASVVLVSSLLTSTGSGYEVRDHDASLTGDPLTDSGGADQIAGMWDAPPLTIIKYVVAMLLLSIGMLGLFPIIGKVKELFNNKNRKMIYEYVVANPACSIASIAEDLQINIGTVDYHLFQLKCRFKIKIVSEGKFRHIYDNTTKYSCEEQTICSHVRNQVSHVILNAILSNPGITQKRLSEIAKLDASTMSYYSNKFLADGLIRVTKDGRYKRYFISEDIKPLLEKHMAIAC